jgi:DNA-binding helix-hairpin-helix protein with protein kinase domain
MTDLTRVSPGAVTLASAGGQVRLGRLLGEGGEGSVFEVAGDPTRVAKVYFNSNEDRRAKLRALLDTSSEAVHQVCAWPLSVIELEGGQTGFLMAKLGSEYHSLDRLTNLRDRLQTFPTSNWRFLLHVGQNLARAFGAVHAAGHVIGDVNESNVRVSATGLVRLIDCDGFQVRHNGLTYRCNVGVPTHTPPELQGLNFSTIDRVPNHDRFGLAVMLFQLLFMGRHPFAGRPGPLMKADWSIESAIKSGYFAYLPNPPPEGLLQPKLTASLDLVSPTLADLFSRSFHPDGARLGRPSVEDWIATLTHQRESLKRCSVDPLHDYAAHHPGCPWCHLEALIPGGGFRYFGVVLRSSPHTPPAQDWSSIRNRLAEALKPISVKPLPSMSTTGLSPSATVQQLLKERSDRFARESAACAAALAEYEQRVSAHHAMCSDAVAHYKAEHQRYTDSLEAWTQLRDSSEASYREAVAKYHVANAALPPVISGRWLTLGAVLGSCGWAVAAVYGIFDLKLDGLWVSVFWSVLITQVAYHNYRSARMKGMPIPVVPNKPEVPNQPSLKEPVAPKQPPPPTRPTLSYPKAPGRSDGEFRVVFEQHDRAERRLREAISRATLHRSKSILVEATPPAQAVVAQLTSLLAQVARIENSRDERVRAAEQRAQDRQLEAYLATKPIREGVVHGIGSQRVVNLRYAGIRTAADVNGADLEAVPGIGPALSAGLLAWRRSIERQYTPKAVHVDTKAIEGDIARKLASLWPDAVKLAAELEAARSKIVGVLRREYQDVSEAAAHCSQTTADINALPP